MAAAMMSATKPRIQTCQVATNSQSAAATPSTWTIIGHGRRELTASSYVAQRWTVRRAGGRPDAQPRLADAAPRLHQGYPRRRPRAPPRTRSGVPRGLEDGGAQ